MKVFVAAAVSMLLLGAAMAEGEKCLNREFWAEAYVNCKDEAKVTSETEKLLLKREIPTSRDGKCFLACIFEKVELCNKEGLMNVSSCSNVCSAVCSADQARGQKLRAAITKCKDAGSSVPADAVDAKCEKAYQVALCVKKEIVQIWSSEGTTEAPNN